MRRGNPGLSGAIIVVQFSVGITIIAASTGAKHTLSTGCAEQLEGKKKQWSQNKKIQVRNKREKFAKRVLCLPKIYIRKLHESGRSLA